MPINFATLASDAVATATTSRLEIRAFSDKERKYRQWNRGFVAPINPETLKVSHNNTLAGQEGLNASGASLSLANNTAEEISFTLVLTDSSAFHYSGRNSFTLFNNYEVDYATNLGYALGFGQQAANLTINSVEAETDEMKATVGLLNSDMGARSLSLGKRDGHVSVAIERFLNLTTQSTLSKGEENAQPAYLGIVWGRVFNRPGGGLSKKGFSAKRKKLYPCYLESADITYTHFTRDGRALRAEIECVFKEDSSDNG